MAERKEYTKKFKDEAAELVLSSDRAIAQICVRTCVEICVEICVNEAASNDSVII